MQFFKDILHLFYPNLCVACKDILLQTEKTICTNCRHNLPIIDTTATTINTLELIFAGSVPIKNIRSFLYYRKHSKVQEIIHNLKYKNHQEIGSLLGFWFGNKLNNETIFTNIDYIVPVPLHPKKLKIRGYNQLTLFGEALSTSLATCYQPHILIRTFQTNTQTFKQRLERFSNTKTKFKLTDTSIFKNKHILLIDDVITTGATLEACCNELLKTENITISIATMAFTEKS